MWDSFGSCVAAHPPPPKAKWIKKYLYIVAYQCISIGSEKAWKIKRGGYDSFKSFSCTVSSSQWGLDHLVHYAGTKIEPSHFLCALVSMDNIHNIVHIMGSMKSPQYIIYWMQISKVLKSNENTKKV